jgi:hypothetical protein
MSVGVRAPLAGRKLAMSDSSILMVSITLTWEKTVTIEYEAAPQSLFSKEQTLRRLEGLAWFMDSAVKIPGTSKTIGADAVMSFVPGVGSLAASGISLYVMAEALRHGAPKGILARMAGNIAADTLLGAIPVIGFLFDMFFKANQRNLNLLRGHLQRSG